MSPIVLAALAALVPYAILEARFAARLRRAPGLLGLGGPVAKTWRRYTLRRALAASAGAACWLAAAVGASGSLKSTRYLTESATGTELAFVLDVSNSMLSPLGESTRLGRARAFAGDLARGVDGATLSLVAFRGSPATLCPSTGDRAAFDEALAWAGPWAASAAGSDLGAAIAEARRPELPPGSARAVIVLSDGNDTGGRARAEVARAAAAGDAMLFVGIGDAKALPAFDQDGRPVPGRTGGQALTSLDAAALRALAEAGRGLYLDAASPEALERAASRLAALRGEGGTRDLRVETDASALAALVALAAAALAYLLAAPPLERPRVPGGGIRSLAVFFLVATLPTLSSCGLARDLSVLKANRLYESGYAHEASAIYLRAGAGAEAVASYDLANVFSSMGEAEAAAALYDVAAARGGKELAARSWYNRGAARFSSGEYREAAAAFRQAIESYGGAEPAGRREADLRRELSRAYELARKAERESLDAGAVERGAYGQGRVDGASQALSVSRTAARTLFLPGRYEPPSAEDH